MIKNAILCEGSAEEAIIELLLMNNCLIIENDESLLNEGPIRTRSADQFVNKHLGFSFKAPINVYRIIDSKNENFNLSKKNQKIFEGKLIIHNIITKPEVEILIIIAEGHFDNYSRKKSKIKPSEYCKNILKMKGVKSYHYVMAYFENIDKLITSLIQYERYIGKHGNEESLVDLLKPEYK